MTNAWDTETWDAFCSLIEEGWPGTFDAAAADSWRVLLDGVPPGDAVAAMRRLLFAGQRFRPSASELLSELRNDPSAPTFEEAYRLIFGPAGVLAARPGTGGPVTFNSEAERRAASNQAALDRANTFHPLVATFVARQGVGHLRSLGVDDPDYGDLRRKELRESWDRHVTAMDGRDVAALAAGHDRSALGLRKFDPLAALSHIAPDQPAIEAGGPA